MNPNLPAGGRRRAGILRYAELPSLSPRTHIMGMSLELPVYTVDMLHDFPDDGNRYELLEGFLIVTPAPNVPHQLIATRLVVEIAPYLARAELAQVVNVGEIERAPKTHLEPDLLVFPGTPPFPKRWNTFRDWWLVAEIFSRSSYIYDRNYKRDAYLALGVREVWLVDPREQQILVSRRNGPTDQHVRDVLRWHPPEMPEPLEIDVPRLFAGLE
jgi:Uma2 family endonuclease